jgi:hypothetical protein
MRKILYITLAALALASCTKRIYVPVETTHTEYVVQHTRDTLTRADSVYVREWLKGDTVMIEKWRERIVYRSSVAKDTLIVRDTIAYPYPVEVVKEVNKLTWWQQTRVNAFWWLLGAVAAAVLWIFRKRIFR